MSTKATLGSGSARL